MESNTTESYTYLEPTDLDNNATLITDLSCNATHHLNVTCELPLTYAIPLYGYFMPILLVITIVANTLIVVVLSKRHMRTPTNVVLMAMALCDMFTLLIPAPWFIYMYTFGNHYRPLAPVGVCYAYNVMNEILPNLFHTSSIWLTLALAVQRYIYVCHPPVARKFCTMPNVNKGLFYIIFAATLHQGLRFFDTKFGEEKILWNNEEHSVCTKTTAYWVVHYVTEDVYYTCYYLFRIIFVHLVPCFALVVLNVLLFKALRQAQHRREQLLSKKTQKTECKKLRDSNCTTLMLIVVVTVFLTVEIPLAVVSTLHVLSSGITEEFLDYYMVNAVVLFINFFIILSYPINFAIYCGMSRQFRETFKELFNKGAEIRNGGSSRYSLVNGPRTCTNETVL
ncbi:sex peptide receptor [Agrilus planipennis]|uniref:Sex peptide receptor n=1 Tax=Agrilus planipennis TaxID=224129 RepID=A0A1W4WUI1_AGRPL|nr:sex peptide receptor [Agrilus planipennis]XP_018324155.1 sex peptide receptor [Agrilus planipennis]XP_025830088.1 sex peptide receptor [Agrilus planipennis]XP_025830089.1 sex peptide receptor [Agrilus planipennis]XP_025830091.1 sex peptide receptor [Agrilus planipennis]XP_025830092.1 sex peptide receptor [Agrilus planipennis]